MNTARLRLALAAGLLIVPAAMAQQSQTNPTGTTTSQAGQPAHKHDDHAGHDHGQPAGQPATIQQAQPLQAVPQLPPFDRLAKLGPDGKVIRIEGVLDIMAIPRNTLIDQATREKIRPLVKNWVADVDQLAIDNLD